jgi:hypothetical protein
MTVSTGIDMSKLAVTTSLLVACSAFGAQAAEQAGPSLETEIVTPLVSNLSQPARSAEWIATPRPDDQVQTRFWWRKGAVELGAGVNLDLPAHRLSAPVRTPTPVIGVRARLGERTRLVAEADPSVLGREAGALDNTTDGARLALEFKTKSPLRDLRTSLLRVQLSGQSALHFRPRGGGMQVTYRESF